MVIVVKKIQRTARKDRQVRTGPAGITVLFLGILCFAMLITPVSAAILVTPVQVSPPTNQHFFHFPRTTTLACKPVAGASHYYFEVQYYDYQWNDMHPVFQSAPYYTFDFIGDQPGRWRVTAIDASGLKNPSKASAWRTFDYLTGEVTLATPVLILPVNGASFFHTPHETTVIWKSVPGANRYTVEVQMYDPITRGWYQNSGSPAVVTGVYTASHTFEFVGQTQGRWRVQATDTTGTYRDSEWSAWRTFRYSA